MITQVGRERLAAYRAEWKQYAASIDQLLEEDNYDANRIYEVS